MNSKFLRSLMISTVTAIIVVALYSAATKEEISEEDIAKIHAIDLEIEELQRELAQLQAGLSLVVLDNKAYLRGFPGRGKVGLMSDQEVLSHDSRMEMYHDIAEVYANDMHLRRASIRELNVDRGMLMMPLEFE